MQNEHEHFMREALAVARAGMELGELPIGAVVVLDGQIIASAHTQEVSQGRLLQGVAWVPLNEMGSDPQVVRVLLALAGNEKECANHHD